VLDDTGLSSILPTLPLVGIHGVVYRSLDWTYHTTVNSVIGSIKAHGRYHHKDDALGTIYLAETHSGAVDEQRQEQQSLFPVLPGQAAGATTVVAPFQIALQRLVDLRHPAVQQELATSLMELTGDWRLQLGWIRRAETQRLAFAAHAAGIEGLIYTSAVGANGNNVVVFSSNLSAQMQATLPLTFPQQSVQFVGQF